MNSVNRRQWLNRIGAAGVAAVAGAGLSAMSKPQQPAKQERLEPADFQPKSMLHVPKTKATRSRLPGKGGPRLAYQVCACTVLSGGRQCLC
jgi:anaerobic selenocysteine-containing dehydrogenase